MDLTVFLAFGAGFLSFISPCSLPLYPVFLSYITGVSVDELKENNGFIKKRAFLHTFFFLLGFSVIFLALGLSTSALGNLFFKYNAVIRQAGAILIIFFGLVVLGFFKPAFLLKDRKVTFRERPSGYAGSILIGMGTAAGWTPCTGPILASVIALSVSHPGQGLIYMLFYVLGFAVPFVIFAFFIGRFNGIKKYHLKLTKTGGALMIVVGVFLYFDWMSKLSSYLTQLFGGFTGF